MNRMAAIPIAIIYDWVTPAEKRDFGGFKNMSTSKTFTDKVS